MEFLLFGIGLFLLIKASDYFVDASIKIAKIFKISQIVIGATIVSLGTTLPEVLVSTTGAIKGLGSMAYGNAIGSIICNTSLIAALTMVFLPGEVNKESLKRPVTFFFVAFVFYAFIAVTFKGFSRLVGIILFSMFAVFVAQVIISEKNKVAKETKKDKKDKNDENLTKQFMILIVSAVIVAFGANLLVDNGTLIAKMIGVPSSVIALTMVALGTSLPELMTAITAIKKGYRELSIGNIIGANFLNLATVSGIAAIVSPFKLSFEDLLYGVNMAFIVDLPVAFIVSLLLCIPPLKTGKTWKWQGIVLLVIYTIYLGLQFFTD